MKAFSAVGALSFFLRSSSLLLASRLRVDGVFFFFWGAKISFPLVSKIVATSLAMLVTSLVMVSTSLLMVSTSLVKKLGNVKKS